MLLSWIAGVIVGIVIGLVMHFAVGGRRSAALSALAGLVGAIAGRSILGHSLPWHPHFIGGIIGAIVLALVWVFATRSRSQPAATS